MTLDAPKKISLKELNISRHHLEPIKTYIWSEKNLDGKNNYQRNILGMIYCLMTTLKQGFKRISKVIFLTSGPKREEKEREPTRGRASS